jgi:hypothetical protein
MSDEHEMKAVGTKLMMSDAGYTLFHCPACNSKHALSVAQPNGWAWNGSGDAPIFSPSIGVSGSEVVRDAAGNWTGEWVRDAAGEPVPSYCHSFIGSSDGSTPGRIQFLGDCTHSMANQLVDLPDFPVEV